MKWFILPIMLFAWSALQGQTTTPGQLPKIRFHDKLFTTAWELGEKDVAQSDIRAHLQKNNADAYYQFRRSESLTNQTSVFLLLGTAGLLCGVLLKNDTAKIAGLGAGVGFGSAALIAALSADSRRDKAVSLYNRFAGY